MSLRRPRVLLALAAVTAFLALPIQAASAYDLVVSTSATRSGAVPLHGYTAKGNIYVFVTPESGATQVRFRLDGNPYMVENQAPFDLAGTSSASGRPAVPFDTRTVAQGSHTVSADVDKAGGGTDVLTATFTVNQASSTPAAPKQVNLAWTGDTSTTMTVRWHQLAGSSRIMRYRRLGGSTWTEVSGSDVVSLSTGVQREARLTDLQPETWYEYQAPGDGGGWSPVRTFRTAPPLGSHSTFDAIFYADTGLAGRTDGLATGTLQGVEEISAMHPLLVLPGGDYAYYDTDKRFGTLENSQTEWFRQQQDVLAQSAVMPTYGNHEVLLGESYDAWARRFPTPIGHDNRRTYSFDVGDVHFISVLAVAESAALPSAQLTWIENDINAARARGQRWIVPYMHVPSFSDGNAHPSNVALRRQLVPFFHRLGVKLVLTSHDQNYERTFPILGTLDSQDRPTLTSTATSCYSMSDGVTWAKVSPAGKMSNKVGIQDFSQWRTLPPPFWTAFRDNTQHHFARLRVSPNSLGLHVYGYEGDGSPAVLLDSLEYRVDGCFGELSANPGRVAFSVAEGGSAAPQTVQVQAGGDLFPIEATENAPWLTATLAAGATPDQLTLTADASGLAPGAYSTAVTIRGTAPGDTRSIEIPLTLTVRGPYSMLYSTSSNRANPLPLEGRTVRGKVYPFLSPDAQVTRVLFWLDNPGRSGAPFMTESNPPFDFAGTSSTTSGGVRLANAWDTTKVATGSHTISAELTLSDGGVQIVDTTFTVQR